MTVTLLMLVSVAMVQLGLAAVTTADASRMRSVAIQLADGALETARYVRDTDVGFYGLAGNLAIDSAGNLVSTACNPAVAPFVAPPSGDACIVSESISGSPVNFYRVLSLSGSADSRSVTVYIFWNNRGTYSSVSNSTILTRWKN